MKQALRTIALRLLFALQLTILISGISMANNYHVSTFEVFITATNNGLLTCTNTAVTLSATSTAGNALFAWAGPHGFTASGATAIVTVPGTYTVTATGTGKAQTASFTIIQ